MFPLECYKYLLGKSYHLSEVPYIKNLSTIGFY
jgi:hypothetical protein